jgi:hypothetical protein
MINRHLILISNPSNPNDENYVKTTEEAIDRWEAFFRSPIGGYWKDRELTRFGEGYEGKLEEKDGKQKVEVF